MSHQIYKDIHYYWDYNEKDNVIGYVTIRDVDFQFGEMMVNFIALDLPLSHAMPGWPSTQLEQWLDEVGNVRFEGHVIKQVGSIIILLEVHADIAKEDWEHFQQLLILHKMSR